MMMTLPERVPEEVVDEMWRIVDLDQDDKINYSEFCKLMHPYPY